MNCTKKLLSVSMVIALAFATTACEEDKLKKTKQESLVSFETVEAQRVTAQANAEYNAQKYRAENPRFEAGFKIVGHTDSTITNECPQGDGWASISIMKVDDKVVEKYKLKCSTVSSSLGCYLDSDFEKKNFATDEDKCQPLGKVPFPLPKIVK